jgi:hypothetical protein
MLATHAPVRWLDAEARDLLAEFWQMAGDAEPFPRALERPLAMALPVSVVKIARLQLQDAESWLQRRRVSLDLADDGSRRRLHGCILAQCGYGFLFLDGADSPDEMRFTMAHEIGHFLADHLLPRKQALAHFGPSIRPVLDGRRAPTMGERLGGALHGIQLDEYQNFLPRSESADGGLELWRVEGRADRIGAALLAPPELVLAYATAPRWADRRRACVEALTERFGFPRAPAERYAEALLAGNNKGPAWGEALRRPPA